jgi:hypothetical protein
MPDQLQLRGGTTVQHSTFTGASKEVTVDTTKKTAVVHDGSTVGGNPLMREDASNSALALGSAAAPSLKFTGDLDSGVFSPGANQVAVATNGVGRLFVDASGNVGVGSSSVATYTGQTYLSVDHTTGGVGIAGINLATNGTRNAFLITYPGNSEALRIASDSATLPITVYTNNSERLRVTSAGLVGIGTSSPANPLHIRNDAGTPQIKLDYLGSSSTIFGSSDLFLQPNGATAMTLKSGGNVGIGTTSPTRSLEVAVGVTSNNGILVTGNNSPGILITETSGNVNLNLVNDSSGAYLGTSSNHPVVLRTNNTERVRLDTSGRLLVGTSSATAGSVDAASIVGSALTQSTGLRSVSSGGTLDLTLLGTGIVGHLYVSSVYGANAAARTNTVFFITTRQGNATVITSLNSANGSTAGSAFTITNPSGNIFRFTDTSSTACAVSMCFVGSMTS